MTDDAIDQALDVAADAILRRARTYDGTEPELARALRNIAINMHPSLCMEPKRFTDALRTVYGYATKRSVMEDIG